MHPNDIEQKMNELRQAAEPLIKYLAQQHHPHVIAIVTNSSVELLEGIMSIPKIDDFNEQSEVCWHNKKVFETDIEYIRAPVQKEAVVTDEEAAVAHIPIKSEEEYYSQDVEVPYYDYRVERMMERYNFLGGCAHVRQQQAAKEEGSLSEFTK